MTRGLVIIKSEHLADAILHATAEPFLIPLEDAQNIFVPANITIDSIGQATGQAVYHWCSGVFSAEHWAAMVALAASLPWAGVYEYDLDVNPSFPKQKLAEIESAETFSMRFSPP